MVTFEEFQKLEIRIGKVLEAERVPNTNKLLKLTVDLGGEIRQLVAGIAEVYHPEDVVGRLIPIVTNLEPRTIRGVESRGMILCAIDSDGKPVLLLPEREVPVGSAVR